MSNPEPEACAQAQKLKILHYLLARAGWEIMGFELNFHNNTARIELRQGSLLVTFDAQHGKASTTRETIRWRSEVVGRRGDRFRAETIGASFLGRTLHTDLREGLSWLSVYLGDNAKRSLNPEELRKILLPEKS